VAGPTSCGKMSFVIDLVKQASSLISPALELIVWVHDDYQPPLEVLKDKVTFLDSCSTSGRTPRRS
jgi:hypothetical protein